MNDMIPTLAVSDGVVRANSRDIAKTFDKEHRNVMQAIDNLIAQAPELRLLNFQQASYSVAGPNGGEASYRCYEMNRDGFTLLAMGFTGSKALKWKLAYIDAFNRMEAALREAAVDASAVLNDPAAMRGLLLSYAEKQMALQGEIEGMRPQVEAYGRLALADGSLCITDAAKTLQVQPKALFAFLKANGWAYTRQGDNALIAYQSKLQAGLLEHKTTTVHRTDGSEKVTTQVRVTPKGLARLAREFPPAVKAA